MRKQKVYPRNKNTGLNRKQAGNQKNPTTQTERL